MTVFYRFFTILLLTISCSAFAQVDPPERELLRPIESQKHVGIMAKDQFELRKLEYFSLPGRFGIFEVDLSALEKPETIVTISPAGGPPVRVISNGIKRNPVFGWFHATWTGEVIEPGTDETRSVELSITTWAIDENGTIKAPDPNRESAMSALAEGRGVITESSLQRIDEEIAHSITGRIVFPRSKRVIEFTHPTNDFEYVAVYEPDGSKVLLQGDDMRRAGSPAESEYEVDRQRRVQAYENFVEALRRELGLAPTERE